MFLIDMKLPEFSAWLQRRPTKGAYITLKSGCRIMVLDDAPYRLRVECADGTVHEYARLLDFSEAVTKKVMFNNS